MGKEIAKQDNKSLFASLQKTTDVAGTGDMIPIEVKEQGVPYVGFFTQKAKKALEIQQAIPGISPGQPYLFDPSTGYTRLSNFKFHLLNRARHWVQRDSENVPIRAVTNDPGDIYGPLKENYETVILVYKDDNTVIPAMCTFNTAKAQVGSIATKTLQEAQDPSWFEKSPDHKATAQIPNPVYRFTVSVSSWVKPSKRSGLPTVNARGTPKPTTVGELQLVSESSMQDGFNDKLNSVVSAFRTRVSNLDELAKKS